MEQLFSGGKGAIGYGTNPFVTTFCLIAILAVFATYVIIKTNKKG